MMSIIVCCTLCFGLIFTGLTFAQVQATHPADPALALHWNGDAALNP
jgi:hypothetical protein